MKQAQVCAYLYTLKDYKRHSIQRFSNFHTGTIEYYTDIHKHVCTYYSLKETKKAIDNFEMSKKVLTLASKEHHITLDI